MKGVLYIEPEYLPYSFTLHAIVPVLLVVLLLRHKPKLAAARLLLQ
jgi:hypothetical protein